MWIMYANSFGSATPYQTYQHVLGTKAKERTYTERIVQVVIVRHRTNGRVGGVRGVVVLPVDVHEAERDEKVSNLESKHPSERPVTHFVINGWRRLSEPREAPWKLKIAGTASSIATCARIGIASCNTALTSLLNNSAALVLAADVTADCQLVAVGFAVVPGMEIPSINSTARTTLTKFFWTVDVIY